MSDDGAHEGILPQRALDTILGGAPAPPPEEGMSTEQMRAWIAAAPSDPQTYDDAARRAAQLILSHLTAHPDDVHLEPFALYDRLKASSPAIEQQISDLDLTGFMWGYAVNAARWVTGLPPEPNPAIIEVGGGDEDGEP